MDNDHNEAMADSGSDASVVKPNSSIYRRKLTELEMDTSRLVRHEVPEVSAPHKNPAWYTKEGVQAYEQSVLNMSGTEWLETLLPITTWIKTYKLKEDLPKDFIAGCTVGFMIVPQSLSYAKLAGLPVQYGLYTSLLPIYAYAFFGTSRQLAVGPVALVSLVVANGIGSLLRKRGISTTDKKAYTAAHAVVSGFISAAAIVIGSSQLKYFFGYSIPQTEIIYNIFKELFKRIDQFNWKTFLFGLLALSLLIFMKNISSIFPKLKYLRVLGPLTVTVMGIILNVIIGFPEHNIPVVGTIPEGLPGPTIHYWTPIHGFNELVPVVLSVGLVGFMESIAIAKKMAAQHKYSIDPSLELIGLGLANFLGSMAGSYPVTGSFSRSAVNNDTGAQTNISGMITASIVLFVLLFLTPIFEKVPQVILGAIVISAVVGLVDYQEAINLWKIDKFDFVVWMISFFTTLFAGVEIGLLVAVGVSLLLVIYESSYPHTAILGRLPGTTVYRNVKQYPEAETFDGTVLVRVDAPIYFANMQNIRDKLDKYEELAQTGKEPLKYIILELSPVPYIDTSALHILEDVITSYQSRDITLMLSNPSVRVMDRLIKSGFVEKIGRQHIFVTAHDAVNYALVQLDIAVSQHGVVKNLDDGDDLEN